MQNMVYGIIKILCLFGEAKVTTFVLLKNFIHNQTNKRLLKIIFLYVNK